MLNADAGGASSCCALFGPFDLRYRNRRVPSPFALLFPIYKRPHRLIFGSKQKQLQRANIKIIAMATDEKTPNTTTTTTEESPFASTPTHSFRSLSFNISIAYSIFGDSSSNKTYLHCHGYPGSRFEAGIYDHVAKQNGVRLVSMDRPGLGGSDPWPDTIVNDPSQVLAKHWPTLVGEFFEHLKRQHPTPQPEEFGVIGLSGGGPYALSTALHLPSITSLIFIAPWTPADRVISYAKMDWAEYLIYMSAVYWPATYLCAKLYGFLQRACNKPLPILRKIIAKTFAHPSDSSAMLDDTDDFGTRFAAEFAESLRPESAPWAMVTDGAILFNKWGIEPEQLNTREGKVKGAIFMGSEDSSCNVAAIDSSYGAIDGIIVKKTYEGMAHLGTIRACREDVGRAMVELMS